MGQVVYVQVFLAQLLFENTHGQVVRANMQVQVFSRILMGQLCASVLVCYSQTGMFDIYL